MRAHEDEMSERKYTISEIDALRNACEMRFLYGTTDLSNFPRQWVSNSYREEVKVKAVEEMVRTYMAGGIVASDIREEDTKRAVAHREAVKPKPTPIDELNARRKQLDDDLAAAR